MPKLISLRLRDELNQVRGELVEEVKRFEADQLDWVPRAGMKTVRALLAEIGAVEWGCGAWATGAAPPDQTWAAQIEGAEDIAAVMQVLQEARAQTLDYLSECSDEELQTMVPVPENSRQYVGGPTMEKEEIFRWIARHEYYHFGQLTIYNWLRGDNPYQRD